MIRARGLGTAALAAVIALAGCGGGGGGNNITNPPAGNTHTESEPNDFTAQSLGTLGTSNFTVGGTSSSDADVDLYRVTLGATANVHVTLSWTGAPDLDVAISNANGITVNHQDTANNPEQCNLNSLPAGTYTLRVGSRTASAAAYTLTIGTH